MPFKQRLSKYYFYRACDIGEMVGLIRKRCIRLKVAVAVAHHDSGVIVGVTVKVAKRPSSFMAL